MKILITAGATWAKIDAVRVLTNRFTGKTGLHLARRLAKKGHAVTLLINPHALSKISGLKVVYFYYFEQFKEILEAILEKNHFDVIIHSAAVSDYLPEESTLGKIQSGKKNLNIKFKPAPKLIKIIRSRAKKALLIQFKLEPKEKGLIEKAFFSLRENNSDFVLACALENLAPSYKAYLLDRKKNITVVESKTHLAKVIDDIIKNQTKQPQRVKNRRV